jgi:hypothetical protein
MNTALQELEYEYKEASKNRANAEILFDIAVKFGRELERQKIDSYRAEYWIRLDELLIKSEKKQEVLKSINNFILKVVRGLIREQIKTKHYWTLDVSRQQYEYNKISEELYKKYLIEFVNAEKSEDATDFNIYFRFTDDLAELLAEYEIGNSIEIIMTNNSGDDEVTIHSELELNKLYDCYTNIGMDRDWDKQKCEDFLVKLTAPYNFMLLSGDVK